MRFERIQDLREAGFVGFLSVARLAETGCTAVPNEPGVYVVCVDAAGLPRFRSRSPAGRHKGKDPTIPVGELRSRWVAKSCVLYIGKAGGVGTKTDLRKRVRGYIRHGTGHSAGHWGGRAIWQLLQARRIRIAWRGCRDPRKVERQMISAFLKQYGIRPFANRVS